MRKLMFALSLMILLIPIPSFAFDGPLEASLICYTNEFLKEKGINAETRYEIIIGCSIAKEVIDAIRYHGWEKQSLEEIEFRIGALIAGELIDYLTRQAIDMMNKPPTK